MATLMVAGGARGGQTRSGGLGQGSKKPAKGSAVALRDAWRHRMAKHGFATPWQLRAARALRNEWRRLAVTTPDERDDPLCASVCAAVQVLADRNKLFGSRPAEVNAALCAEGADRTRSCCERWQRRPWAAYQRP